MNQELLNAKLSVKSHKGIWFVQSDVLVVELGLRFVNSGGTDDQVCEFTDRERPELITLFRNINRHSRHDSSHNADW